TAGAANPADIFTINDNFGILIPIGTPINPVTGTNWEGIGVIPDVITTAENAFDIAVDLAMNVEAS
ncbi:MAG: peptidase S41, partial [Desulfobacterales bacterium]|nr:peptidase S41 [Desulfobacterales bacterium]